MLYLDSTLEISGVTIFRDYNTPSRCYYLPSSPHITRENGDLLFQLLIYREDISDTPELNADNRDGGGFLTMTVDLGVSQSTLDAIKVELDSRTGVSVDLMPVPIDNGSVRVTALGESSGATSGDGNDEQLGSGFIENILGSTKPSMYGDNRAVFSIELSKRGALLMKASIEGGGASQIAVVYDLEYKGLMPARECTIKIETKQAYEYIRNRATINTLWFKADIDSEMEKLVKDQTIQIEDVDYLGLDPEKTAERTKELNKLAKELATWTFFKPGLQPGKVLAADRGELSVYDPTTDATANTAGFTTSLETAATGRGNTGDTAGPRHAGTSAASATTRAGGQQPPAAGSSPSTSSGDAGGERDLTAVERWNRAGRPQAGYLMKSLSQEEQQKITYNLRQVSAIKRNISPQSTIRFASRSKDLADRILVVDLNDPFFERIAGTVTTTADLAAAGVRSAIVAIKYGVRPDGTGPKDTKEDKLLQKGDTWNYQFHLDHQLQMYIEYQVTFNYIADFSIGDDSHQSVSPWISTTARNLDIDPRLLGMIFPVTLTSGTVDWNTVKQIQTTVEYSDPDNGILINKQVIIDQQNQTAVINIRPKPGGPRDFKVSSTYFYSDTQDGPIVQEGRDASLIVLNQPASKAIPVNIDLVDPLGRIRKVAVELSYKGASGNVQQKNITLTGDGATEVWTYFRDSIDEDALYSYRVTTFGIDGTIKQDEPEVTKERQLIVGDIISGMHEVEVIVMSENLRTAGFLLAKLRLEYPDAPEWADADVEKVFQGAPQPFKWRVPTKVGGGNEYNFTVQWFAIDGQRTTTGPETVSDEVLILIPPTRG